MDSDRIAKKIEVFLDEVVEKYPVFQHQYEWDSLIAKMVGMVDLYTTLVRDVKMASMDASNLNAARTFLKTFHDAYTGAHENNDMEVVPGESVFMDEVGDFLEATEEF